MSNINNNDFSWCKNFYVARTNYSKAQAIQGLKEQMRTFSGVDPAFKQSFLNGSESQFVIEFGYLPAYCFDVTAAFSWNETHTDKLYGDKGTKLEINTKDKYRQCRTKTSWTANSGPASCEVLKFIGSESQRFQALNLPSDLPYPLYSPSQDVMSSEQIKRFVNSHAPEKDLSRWEAREIVGYTASAVFVPMVKISMYFQNRQYMSIVNLHNGLLHCSYPTSQAVKNDAKNASDRLEPYLRAQLPILILSPIISCIWLFLVKGSTGWDILFTIAMVIFEFAFMSTLPAESKFVEAYRKSKQEGDSMLTDSISSFRIGVIVWVIGVIAHFFVGL